jgi:Lrp/AsnC family transcriptional regulator, regulator for asnA, asnC and gidA
MTTDKTDNEILAILLENSRLSYRQIAKKMKRSVVTVLNRMKAMEEEGIIKGYIVDLDYEKLGYEMSVMVHMRISKGMLPEVERKIASIPSVYAVYDVTGEFDAVVLAQFRSRTAMDSFIKKVQKMEFIERTKTELILNKVKEDRMNIN